MLREHLGPSARLGEALVVLLADDAGEELMPGVWFKVEAPGEGSAPEYKQVVECSFTGRIQGADEVFEEVRHRRVRVGDGDVPPALELALKRMRARERALVRADFIPGLGLMLDRNTWDELGPKWPKGDCDDWQREPAQRRGRQKSFARSDGGPRSV